MSGTLTRQLSGNLNSFKENFFSAASGRWSEGDSLPADVAVGAGADKATFNVVTDEIPDELLELLRRDFTAAEIAIIYARVNFTIAPSVQQPGALFVLGPSAVGKSVFIAAQVPPQKTHAPKITACRIALLPTCAPFRSCLITRFAIAAAQAISLFGSVNNAVIVDGAEFREAHAGFQAVTVHGLEHKVLHADAWKIFRSVEATEGKGKGISTKLKKTILHAAIENRQHLIIPDCANYPSRLHATIQMIRDAGYNVHAICLWAPLSVCQERGEPRSMREGKLWSGDDYELSVQGSLAIALRWQEGMDAEPEGGYKSLAMWDNCHYPAQEVGLARFVELSNMSAVEADTHTDDRRRAHVTEHARHGKASTSALPKLLAKKGPKQRLVKGAREWNERSRQGKSPARDPVVSGSSSGGCNGGGGDGSSSSDAAKGVTHEVLSAHECAIGIDHSGPVVDPTRTSALRRASAMGPRGLFSVRWSPFTNLSLMRAGGVGATVGGGDLRRQRAGSKYVSPSQLPVDGSRSRGHTEGTACGLLAGALVGALIGSLVSLSAVGAI